ncbi:transcriptional repressor LexA [Alkalihalobacillus clausii]|jgi:SOS regulatory protein LexA|uniref:transcriptional repressor LexA n=1 Tax=Shouchella clausii TaxID=79880 RepID=UPI001C21F7B2|nr:transcriptional repressor LexA [Shouchella clausii]MBU8598454.1 transcriptional repressor LexA [Shouchella clausii]
MKTKAIEFGEYLRLRRKEKGFTIRQLEMKSGVSNAYLSHLENGKRGIPSTEIIKKISGALDIPYTEMLQKAGHLDEANLLQHAPSFPDIKEQLSVPPGHISVPILGYISAGKPVLAEEHIENYMDIPSSAFNIEEGKHFLLRVKGDSMINARIHDGDMVMVRMQCDVESGEIAVINIDGENATLKRVRKTDTGQTWLFPENEKYEPILISNSDARIIGKVVKIFIDP